jgi:trimeric autotransporter adhesin
MFEFRAAVFAALVCVLAGWTTSAHAVAPHEESPPPAAAWPSLRVEAERLEVATSLLADAQRDITLAGRTAGFLHRHGQQWEIRWDTRGDRAAVVQGQGIPLLPGRGNRLRADSLALDGDPAADLAKVATLARAFIDSVPELLGADAIELRLDAERSTGFGPANERWFLEFQQFHHGVPVDGAFVYVRIVHGNIVQFGAERIGAPRLQVGKAAQDAADAGFAVAWRELGFPAGTAVREWLARGELRIYPVLPAGARPATEHAGVRGMGYDHLLARRYVFRVDEHATWQLLVDADSGAVIDLRDLTVHADAVVSGGVYPATNTDPSVPVQFPFTAVSNNGPQVTDIDGVYDYGGGTASTTLNGRYFRMQDNCGAISLSNSVDGNLDFGTSGGTDCSTPGFGGAGNTHASRTGFYHLTLINAKARSILPANGWLQGTVTANMNINNQCNATWNGSAVNFYRSGGGCSNTGEIAAVFLHEWGHGIDTNTGGAASENGSGEAVGDTFAFLETRDSCIGPNFRPGVACHNCVSCTGVRDVGDFGLSGTRVIATPANITHDNGINCDRFLNTNGTVNCPYNTPQGFAYRGPMGYQGHCESHIASTANWDLKNALVAEFGDSGWQRMDGIWYGSLVPSKSAYRVASGGTCNPAAAVDGCGATNWYTVFLAADDDDGNLANGTPNACRIWDALDAHGIACGTRPACTEFATADFTLAVDAPEQQICVGDSAPFVIGVGSQYGFDAAVTLAISGVPAGADASFSTNPVLPAGDSTLLVDAGTALPGNYPLLVQGSAAGSDGRVLELELRIDGAAAGSPSLQLPADLAANVAIAPLLSWQPVADAVDYQVEVARDAAFTDLVAAPAGIVGDSWQAPPLAPDTRYHWRVTARNGCGSGQASAPRSFTTLAQYCSSPNVAIPDNNPTGVTDTMALETDATLAGLRLVLRANHTWVGDLSFRLSHLQASALVVDRPGVPASTYGCSGDNIDAVLDDDAAVAIEGRCEASVPTISGVLRPNEAMGAAFAGLPAGGSWSLQATDAVGSDTGTLLEWCLEPEFVQPQAYTIGGSVTGLAGSGLELRLNGGALLAIGADGDFVFPEPLADGSAYAVEVASQPVAPGQSCTVDNGTGALAGADVTDVAVRCETLQYALGGTLDGLEGSGLALQLNDGDPLPLSSDGDFAFPATLADGSAYAVVVASQPTAPNQACTVENGAGIVSGADVADIEVRCTTLHYRVGGSVSGLLGSGLALALNDGAPLSIAGDGPFVFDETMPQGSGYAVAVVAAPVDPVQVCAVDNGAGILGGGDIEDVQVRCRLEGIFADGFD